MMRFSENQPWHFAITPSAYFEEQKKSLRCSTQDINEIKRRIQLHHFSVSFKNGDDLLLLALDKFEKGIHTLDELYTSTLETPALDLTFDRRYPQLYARTAEPTDLSLILRYAKPAGIIGFDDEPILPLGFYKIPFDPFFGNFPTPQKLFYVTSCVEILEQLDYYQERLRRMNKDDFGVKTYRDLVHGILFGYPVADVLEQNTYFNKDVLLDRWKQENNYRTNLGLLCHVPRPQLWTAQWCENVGMKGEEHLHEVYRKVLGVDGLV